MKKTDIEYIESYYGINFDKEYPIKEISKVNSKSDADNYLRYRLTDLLYTNFPSGKVLSELNAYQELLNNRHRSLSKKPTPNDNDCALLIGYYFTIVQISDWVKKIEATNCSALTGYEKMHELYLPKLPKKEPVKTEWRYKNTTGKAAWDPPEMNYHFGPEAMDLLMKLRNDKMDDYIDFDINPDENKKLDDDLESESE